jgi:hypothetical protein
MMKAVSTYEITVHFCKSTRRNIAGGSHGQEIPFSITHTHTNKHCVLPYVRTQKRKEMWLTTSAASVKLY